MSRLLAEIHETARDMYRLGIISEEKMKEYDRLCLPQDAIYSPEKIKELRESLFLSQNKLAEALHIKVSTVKKWEMGEKKPSRWAQKHLCALSSKILA